jgi:hypothetical protein
LGWATDAVLTKIRDPYCDASLAQAKQLRRGEEAML